jgi:myo-inositol-1(or 4)-monophosphatase
MPISTFSLALVKDGEPVIGVIYDFHHDRLFGAIKGKGAWLNGVALPSVLDKDPLKLVNLEWYPSAAHNLAGSRERLFAHAFQVPNYATNLFVSTSVALGRAAATVYAGDKSWDAAAAKVIAEACGCIVTDLYGAEQRYDQPIGGVIVAHPAYYKLVLAAVTPK